MQERVKLHFLTDFETFEMEKAIIVPQIRADVPISRPAALRTTF